MLRFIIIRLWQLSFFLTALTSHQYFAAVFFLHSFLIGSFGPDYQPCVIEVISRHKDLPFYFGRVVQSVYQIRIHSWAVLKQRHDVLSGSLQSELSVRLTSSFGWILHIHWFIVSSFVLVHSCLHHYTVMQSI